MIEHGLGAIEARSVDFTAFADLRRIDEIYPFLLNLTVS